MAYLYNKQSKKVESFTYELNTTFYEHEAGEVIIVFEDEKFARAEFPMKGMYSRTAWRILADIEAAITAIEKEYAEKAKA
jgi:ABC-type sulfate transport system substrate-binding protein